MYLSIPKIIFPDKFFKCYRDPGCTGTVTSNYHGLLTATVTVMLQFLHGKEDKNLKVKHGSSTELALLSFHDLLKILKDKHHQKSKALNKKRTTKTTEKKQGRS